MSNPIIDKSGNQWWYYDKDDLHREDGPAYIGIAGGQSWWVNGQLHRTDGPAVIRANGNRLWYLNDKQIFSNKRFREAANLTDEEMTLIILKYGSID